MTNPLVSIIIATYNSEKLLPRTLNSIKVQTYKEIEVLVIDGGSSDMTVEIAKSYGCKVINNPKVDAGFAKLLGVKESNGKYLVTLDHDEVMQNPNSIKLKVKALEEHPDCKIAHCSGYMRPEGYPRLNQYVSEYGDPFSLFVYRNSKDHQFFQSMLSKQSELIFDEKDYSIYAFNEKGNLPLIEVAAMGIMFDKAYFVENTDIENNLFTLSHLFYLMVQSGINKLIVLKNDPLVHYSLDSIKAYFPKLRYRVCNNVHANTGNSFQYRNNFQTGLRKYKKYLYVLYAAPFVVAELDGVFMAIRRRNIAYLLHGVFAFYVMYEIGVQYLKKLLGISPKLRNYNGEREL